MGGIVHMIGWFLAESQLKGDASRPSIAERFSSPMLSQGQTSSASSKGDRRISSSPYSRQLHLAHESSSHSHFEKSRHKEEVTLIRTIAEVHCVLAEVRGQWRGCVAFQRWKIMLDCNDTCPACRPRNLSFKQVALNF